MAPRAPLLSAPGRAPAGRVRAAAARARGSAPRAGAPRASGRPPFVGGDPAAKGWVKVDDGLLWVEARDAEAFRAGRLRLGDGAPCPSPRRTASRSPPRTGTCCGRTTCSCARTSPFARARELAAQAETHVGRVLEVYGHALDLRLPEDPLRLVVASRRVGVRAGCSQEKVADPVDWGAFYEAKDGVVYASDEPLGQGGVGVVADLRHEMTHAILDLGRPGVGPGAHVRAAALLDLGGLGPVRGGAGRPGGRARRPRALRALPAAARLGRGHPARDAVRARPGRVRSAVTTTRPRRVHAMAARRRRRRRAAGRRCPSSRT